MVIPIATAFFNSPSNPARPVDWRWLRAIDLVERGESARGPYDDPEVSNAVKFVRALRACRNDADQQRLAASLPGPVQALELYAGSPTLARAEIEARLLTEEPFEAIARKCETTAAAAAAYEMLFFCVRDRLHCPGWICWHAIWATPYGGADGNDLRAVLLMRAYAVGLDALEALLDHVKHPPVLPDSLEQLDSAERVEVAKKLLIEASLVVDQLPIDTRAMKKLTVLQDAVAVFKRAAAPAATVPALPVGADAGFSKLLTAESMEVEEWTTEESAARYREEAIPLAGATRAMNRLEQTTAVGEEIPAAVA